MLIAFRTHPVLLANFFQPDVRNNGRFDERRSPCRLIRNHAFSPIVPISAI
jgi:hypothetical protein